jgi:hypothetical protein
MNAPVRHPVNPGADVRQETAPADALAPLQSGAPDAPAPLQSEADAAPIIYIDLDSLDACKRPGDFRSSFSAWEAPR